MRTLRTLLLVFALALTAARADAALNVFACEPEWAALATELGGDQLKVYSATTGLQDPHRIEARPSLIARARGADLLVCTGAELEIGWLPQLLQQAANPKIRPTAAGHFLAYEHVTMLEVPTKLDRAEGDIHALGNPHIQFDPRHFLAIATALAKRMGELDAGNAAHYEARRADFVARLRVAIAKWEGQAAVLKNLPVVVQHREFAYLNRWLGMREVAALEPKPGIEPTTSHLTQVLETLKQQPARMVLRTTYQSERPSRWLAQRAKIVAVALPASVGGSEGARDLFGWFNDIIARLLRASAS